MYFLKQSSFLANQLPALLPFFINCGTAVVFNMCSNDRKLEIVVVELKYSYILWEKKFLFWTLVVESESKPYCKYSWIQRVTILPIVFFLSVVVNKDILWMMWRTSWNLCLRNKTLCCFLQMESSLTLVVDSATLLLNYGGFKMYLSQKQHY